MIVSNVIHPLLSVTVTLYVPAARFWGSSTELVYPAGPVQLNVYNGDVVFGVPPVTVRSISPLLSW